LEAVQKFWHNVAFEELRTIVEWWRDALRQIIQHDREYLIKWHLCQLN
jgi:hypothetical protein